LAFPSVVAPRKAKTQERTQRNKSKKNVLMACWVEMLSSPTVGASPVPTVVLCRPSATFLGASVFFWHSRQLLLHAKQKAGKEKKKK
jgi:hypothetical protein